MKWGSISEETSEASGDEKEVSSQRDVSDGDEEVNFDNLPESEDEGVGPLDNKNIDNEGELIITASWTQTTPILNHK